MSGAPVVSRVASEREHVCDTSRGILHVLPVDTVPDCQRCLGVAALETVTETTFIGDNSVLIKCQFSK